MKEQTAYTEALLIDALKNHNNEAYRYLYLQYRGALYNVICQIIPDTESANDVLQEVFIAVWKNMEKYDADKGRLFTWLLNITRNTAINKLRSKNYKNNLKTDDLNNFVSYIDDKTSYQQNINSIGLRKQVSALKEEFKAVLELAYFNGLTHDEVAKSLNIPIGTVKTRMRNAVLELKKHFM